MATHKLLKSSLPHLSTIPTGNPLKSQLTARTLCHFVPSNLWSNTANYEGPSRDRYFANLTPITVYQFNTELSRCLQFCGLDTTRYKGHSFRIGAASLAADKDFSDPQIRTLGRWKSDAFKLDIRSEHLKPIKLNISIGHAPSKHLTSFSISVFYFSPASEM